MKALCRALVKIDGIVEKGARYFIIFAIIAIMILLSLGVFVRLWPLFSMAGYDEIIEFLFAWMTFIGALSLWREDALFKVEILRNLQPLAAAWVRFLVSILLLLFAIVFTWWGWIFAAGATESTPFLMFPKKPWFFSMPVAGVLMIPYAVASIFSIYPSLRHRTRLRPQSSNTLYP
jgi:TRAP-type C4-dicarboxylate transport system permease small subunit